MPNRHIIIGRAWRDTRKLLKLETKEAIIVWLAVPLIATFFTWKTTGDLNFSVRFIPIIATFTLIVPVFIYKLTLVPLVIRDEKIAEQEETINDLRDQIDIQSSNQSSMERKVEDLGQLVRELANQQHNAASGQLEVPVYLQDLKSENSEVFRRRVDNLTFKMRQMESSFRATRTLLLSSGRSDWSPQPNQFAAQGEEQNAVWRRELLPEAVAIWDELRRRIYGAPPYPCNVRKEIALEHGMLVGPAPLTDAATEIERLYRMINN